MGFLRRGLVWLVVLPFSPYDLLFTLLEQPAQLEVVDTFGGFKLDHLTDEVGELRGYLRTKLLLDYL